MHDQPDRQPVAIALTPVTMDSSARIARRLRQQPPTANVRAIPAGGRPRPGDRAAGPAAYAVGLGRPVSLLVVYEGVVEAFLLVASAREALTEGVAAATAAERGVARAGPTRLISLPSPDRSELIDDSAGDNEADDDLLISEILRWLPDRTPSSSRRERRLSPDKLTTAETRVLRYLSTNLTATEIAHELYLSVHTVKSHMRHIYAKLGAHRRREAVEQARALGLLADRRPCRRALDSP